MARINVFAGPNGSGKTNLLEAVSLLVPGRGLRGAKFSECARRGANASGGWAVAARLTGAGGPLEIGTGVVQGAPERRVFQLDGLPARAQAQIGNRLAAVWLTPQMDRLFGDAASGRRRFLDRLVLALEPAHGREIAAFEAACAQRNRLLAEAADPLWLDGLEEAMARHAVAAVAARMALVTRLNASIEAGVADPFPRVQLALDCAIAEQLASAPALNVEEWLREAYGNFRAQDAANRHGASLGPQRGDLSIAAAGRDAAFASTGQQKAMLIGIVLGHAALIARARGVAPLLLLDEPLVHLDAAHRQALFAALQNFQLTAWLTGTDADMFAGLQAACYSIRDGVIERR